MKRSRRLRLLPPLALALLATPLAHAQRRPSYDASFARKAAPVGALSLRAPRAAAVSSRPALPVQVASTDRAGGVPSFLWAARGAFTPLSSTSTSTTTARPDEAARAHLGRLAGLYDLPPAAIAAAVLREVHDSGRGGVVVTFGQEVDGVEVFGEKTKLLLRRGSLDLVAASGHLHGAAVARTRAGARLFRLPPQQAVAAALDDLHGLGASPGAMVEMPPGAGGYRRFDLAAPAPAPAATIRFFRPARVKKVFFPMPGHLVPGYYLEVFTQPLGARGGSEAYAYVIAADDGRVLHRADLTAHDTYQYRVWAETTGNGRPLDGPTADYTPHPAGMPDGSYPEFIAPALVSMDGFNTNPDGKGDPWLPVGATKSSGNNVDAYADDDDPDGFSPGDIRASVTGPKAFDRVYDTGASPTVTDEQRMAAVTQLFYTINWLHDYWYDSGFDEAAGNAQASNYGRGGLGGDSIDAQAQDGAALGNLDNANMFTPADGESPRMQMYVWSGSETRTLTVQSQPLDSGSAQFGVKAFSVSGAVVLVDDGADPVTDACEAIVNDVAGKIALLDRGDCTFQGKVQAAEAAGAIAVLVANNVPGPAPQMPGDDSMDPTIPVLSVSRNDGDAIKSALLAGPVTASLGRVVGPLVDGSIDNLVVAHEWGHYLHHRLVDCDLNQCGGESEGWGDFIALALALREGDDLDGTFADTVYATVATPEAAYFGTRRFPYSVDLSKNPLTFKNISDEVPLPTEAPSNDWGGPSSESHNSGEVWASMLFEAYVALLRESQGPTPRYSFEEARRRMADYVVAGMKLAPRDPTFTEQRDAILAAAYAADLKDTALLAAAFARRGAGSCAASPARDSDDNNGVVESYEVGPAVAITAITVEADGTSCDSDSIIDAEESGHVTIDVMNGGITPLVDTEVTVSASAAGVRFPAGAKATIATIEPFGVAHLSFEIGVDRALADPTPVVLTVEAHNAAACVPTVTRAQAVRVNYDNVLAASASDGFESDADVWKPEGDDAPAVWSKEVDASLNHTWRARDLDYQTDSWIESPSFQASATDKLVITFRHRHSFETGPEEEGGPDFYWDGAVVELSSDGGNTWKDVEGLGASPGYGGKITATSGNPIGGRQGFVHTNAAWPEMETVTLDFGTKLAGQAITLRFRIGTDAAEHDVGWEIDDVAIAGIDNTPFPAVQADKATCSLPPVADAGEGRTVGPGDDVTLDASKSADPEGDPLSFQWTQTAGPAATLSSAKSVTARFTPPAVTAPTTLTFQVSVSDGLSAASDTVDILVDPARAPTLVAAGGCGCEVAPSDAPRPLAPLVAAALLALRRRRRR